MPGALPISLRLTSRQVAGRALQIGAFTALVLTLPVLALAIDHSLMWIELAIPFLGFIVAAVVSVPLIKRGGVDLDKLGVHPVLPGPARRDYAPWHQIQEIRAERRAGRTVPVIYLTSGKAWRLRVPYDGILLGKDPHFDEKLGVLRNMWETYHSWQQDPATADE